MTAILPYNSSMVGINKKKSVELISFIYKKVVERPDSNKRIQCPTLG